ncbi:MAG: NINE protein [Gammaproteobacteria bacterium]
MDTPVITPSPKSYVVAVCLSSIFGVMGIHHLYLGRWGEFLIDFALFVLTIYFYFSGELILAVIFGLIDMLHTFVITIMLLTGSFKDGDGKLVCYPGQRLS